MRVAFVADVHGRLASLRPLLDTASVHGCEQVVCAGDLLDCLVSKSAAPREGLGLADVVADDPQLWGLARRMCLVRGNQEERVAHLLRDVELPADLRAVLEQPESRRLGPVRVVHGHRFTWQRRPDGWWQPSAADVAGLTDWLTVYGHNHQNACYQVGGDGVLHPRPIRFGEPMALAGGVRHLVNVDAARRDEPSLVVYDGAARTITYHRVSASGRESA